MTAESIEQDAKTKRGKTAPEPQREPTTYELLAAPFDHTFTDTRGGVQLEYLTGEQVISRLNEVLGPGGWSFTILNHGLNEEADEYWVHGRLEATIDGMDVHRAQFGSNKVKRSRANGSPLDIGFDLKGAGTDCLKKCASLIGVGLYLSRKDEQVAISRGPGGGRPARAPAPDVTVDEDDLICADCGTELKETRFRDGAVWTPQDLAAFGKRKHGRPLCMAHYRQANEALRSGKQQEERIPYRGNEPPPPDLDTIPF